MGAVGALSGPGWSSAPTRAAMLGVNCAAAAAFVQGSWSAAQLSHRPPLLLPVSDTSWHAMPVDQVLDQLNATSAGLSEEDAAHRRGQGRRPQLVRTSLARAVMEELDNPLTPILAAGAVLSASLGSVVDAGLVAGVSALSALIGGAQRLHTDRAMAALLAHSAITARVLRDGGPVRRPAQQLVPGDIVELRSGAWCPPIAGC
jgi:cation-transporting ATPase I